MLFKNVLIATTLATSLTFVACSKQPEQADTNAIDTQAAAAEAEAQAQAANEAIEAATAADQTPAEEPVLELQQTETENAASASATAE